MKNHIVPLFPLQVVLFPEARMPLHIFEERYKSLVNDCLRADSEFGIQCQSGGELAAIGCTARVIAVVKVYSDGRMDIVVEGHRRFRVKHYDAKRAPYLTGEVEFLDDFEEEVDPFLIRETIRLYNNLVTLVYKDKVKPLDENNRGGDISFVMAQKAGMDLEQRQKILELESESERLRVIHDYLESVIPKLEQAGELERIIRSDGYLPRDSSTEEE